MRSIPSLLLAIGFLALSPAAALHAQLELGLKGGFSAYSGDLSPQAVWLFDDMEFSGGAYLRYRPVNRVGLRINGNFGRLSGARVIRLPNESGEAVQVPQSFQTSFSEFNVVGELDLFYIGDPEGNFLAPYLYAGGGVLSFDPKGPDQDGNLVSLQPLATEGQGLANINPAYAPAKYSLTTLVGVVGAGVRVRFADRFVVGVEFGGRYTGTDYLDDVGSTEINYQDIFRSEGGSQAAFFSNPAVTNPAEAGQVRYTRGGENPDYYFVGGLTFGITLGEGGGGKGCYSF